MDTWQGDFGRGGGVRKVKNSRTLGWWKTDNFRWQVLDSARRRERVRCVAKRLIVEALDGVGGHQGGGGEHHPGGAEGRARFYPNFQIRQQNFNKNTIKL